MKKLDRIVSRFLWGFLGLVFLFLTIQSYLKTAIIDIYFEGQEKVVYEKDNLLIHVLFFLLILFIMHMISKKENLLKIVSIVQVVMVFLGFLYFLSVVHMEPVFDQKNVLITAMEMRLHLYANFTKGYYLDMCPHQGGLVLFYYLISPIIGKWGVEGFIFVNFFCAFWLFFFMRKLAYEIYEIENKHFISIVIYGCIPMLLYVSYLYGIIPGLMFNVIGFYYGIKSCKSKKIIHILISTLSMAIGVQLKLNYVIFAIAMICLWILMFIEKGSKEYIIAIALMILLLAGFNGAVKLSLESMTGIEQSKGIPANGYILMGLSENSARAEGWYNGIPHWIYLNVGSDTEAAREFCGSLLEDRIQEMKEHKLDTIRFFYNKICSQWLEPSFQGLWLYETNPLSEDMPKWAYTIFRDNRSYYIIEIMNLFQSVIYLGAFLFAFFNRKSHNYLYLLLPIGFIGGFLFHLFWEAKAQYALPYFFLLIPMAVCGLVEFEGRLSGYIEKRLKKTA